MKYYFGLILLTLLSSCGNKEKIKEVALPKDFTAFYEKFHADSIYQLNHIRFPLEGLPSIADNADAMDFHWGIENWEMHKPFADDNKEYNRVLTVVDSSIIIETIRMENNQYGMERRFAKFGKEWQLIYYAAMNKLVNKNDADSVNY